VEEIAKGMQGINTPRSTKMVKRSMVKSERMEQMAFLFKELRRSLESSYGGSDSVFSSKSCSGSFVYMLDSKVESKLDRKLNDFVTKLPGIFVIK
jgi:hypothetical protein